MSTMLILEGGGYLWVYENIEEDYDEEQEFTVINGAWDGIYYNGIISVESPFYANDEYHLINVKEVVHEFDREGDYNEVITKLQIRRGEI